MSCFQPLSLLAGGPRLPLDPKRQVGWPAPGPPGMAQEAAPVLLVVLARLVSSTWHEGECRGVRAQRGSRGTAAHRVPFPSGARGGKGGMEGGVPWYGDAGESIGACGVRGACGGAPWGTGRSGGSAGRHPERSRKPASPSRPCLRESSFPADSLLPRGPSAGRCLLDGALRSTPSPAARQLGQRSKALALFGGVSPFPAPRPHPLAMLPALLAGDAPASWPQVRNKSQRLHEKGTSQLNGTSACGLWQGGSAASPPGETALLPGSPTHPHHQPCARPGPLCSPREPWQRGKRVGIKGLWKRVGDLKKLVGSGGE